MELYIDMIFLVSWSMNAFLLWAAGRIAGFSAKKWRIFLGGFLSAAIYCLWLICLRRNGGIACSLFLLWMGLFAAYRPKQGRNWLRLCGAAAVVSFLLGGMVNVLFTMTQVQRTFGQGMVVPKVYPWWLLPWAIGTAYLLLKWGAKWLQAHIVRRREYCTAAVLWRGKGIEGRMLIDTGNGLQEKGRGVAVAELSLLLPLFSKEEQVRLLSGQMEGLEWLSFTSLGNPDGRLWGIRAERLIVSFGETQVVHQNIFVGISRETFTGAYEGLLPPCLIEEE